MGSKTLFNAVFVNPVQVVHFLLYIYARNIDREVFRTDRAAKERSRSVVRLETRLNWNIKFFYLCMTYNLVIFISSSGYLVD